MLDPGLLRALPQPAPEQYAAFAAHLCGAHSWYKHLPLLEGGRFVVFLAPDAGAGFPPERPRLHHSWRTTAEYHARFGLLDYLWSTGPDQPFERDSGPLPELPEVVWERCSLRLYPYVSNDMNAIEAIGYGVHAEALEQLRAGAPHPQRDLVLAWAGLHARDAELWAELSDEECSRALDYQDAKTGARSDPSPAVRAYLALSARLHQVYAQLQAGEQRKIVHALEQLQQMLSSKC
ncbi:MAG: hypothetical protein OHK0022_45810 [Roseiflexaceae bacterium]